MRSRRRTRLLFGACLVCLSYGLVSAVSESALARTGTAAAPKSTVINVIAGKPSELAFKLSKSSLLPVGAITFNVKNEGLSPHDFKLCAAPTTSAARNVCIGRKTKLLQPGQTATLIVVVTK